MKVKMILPALIEAKSPYWRPIKYSLFPPLGLATLACFFPESDEIEIQDEHVETLFLEDSPDLVIIEVYITNAFRAYQIADQYRGRGIMVILGGLHVSSLPDEAALHADSIFIGPGEDTLPQFLHDLKKKQIQKKYISSLKSLSGLPAVRRDLIKRNLYLVPNSIVVSKGCPHHCDFCYKDAFFKNIKSFYTQTVDSAIKEIFKLPGKHLYFLDDHLFAKPEFVRQLFFEMRNMNRVFQAAATVDSIVRDDLIEKAAESGLRSMFIGFETLNAGNLQNSNKRQNKIKEYDIAIKKLHSMNVKINASFVFGFDNDDKDVFKRTVDWSIKNGFTTVTFHILTPYPGTKLFFEMEREHRIKTKNWDLYDTRHVVYKPAGKLTEHEIIEGYNWAYKEFYKWSSIFKTSMQHDLIKQKIYNFAYTGAWKKLEPLWNFIIKNRALNKMIPLLEKVLSGGNQDGNDTDKKIFKHTASTVLQKAV